MKILKLALIVIGVSLISSCASRYNSISPKSITYMSSNTDDGVTVSYKYDLLSKKYAKKEDTKGLKLVAVKITNNTDRDLKFGEDIKLTYENGNTLQILNHKRVFNMLKQNPASYLWYLLLTPVNLYTSETNDFGVQESTSSTPIGLVIGPGLAGGNMIAASSANGKFEDELFDYSITGTVIKKGKTVYGLIGVRTYSFDAIKAVVN